MSGARVPNQRAIVDRRALAEAIAGLHAQDRESARPAIVAALKQALADGRAELARRLEEKPAAGHEITGGHAFLIDQIVRVIFEHATDHLYPAPNRTAAERIAVMAVGGYGRAEMCPHSDVDIAFLTPQRATPWCEQVVEAMLYLMWDLGLQIGHSTRTPADLVRIAREDLTVRTAFLEGRYIWGDEALHQEAVQRFLGDVVKGTERDFVTQKLAERNERHKRMGDSRYVVEPNVKEGKGGLRDLQTLFWIAKYLNRAATGEDLVALGVFTPEEYANFTGAARFLWTVRVHLHLLSGRAVEQLTFDTQVEIARILGYEDTEGQRAVERFMQNYFLQAKHVGDLTRIFLTGLEARHIKPKPGIGQTLRAVFAFGRGAAPSGYKLRHGRIDVADAETFLADPLNILRLFAEGQATGIPIHPDALRLITQNLHLIDDALRADPVANRIFLEILLGRSKPEIGLRLMNEVGVLGAFIPEFGRIVAMMQFNMYHYYTVDEHILRTIAILSRLERGELVEDLPTSTGIMREGVDRRVLYVALFLHDIGKGSGRDHSEVGAEIAETLARRFGLNDEETELVVWLVRHHLLMSDTAQKRDLTEPRTVRDFATIVKSQTRLKLLAVLTVCDIRGVGPTIWNNWKATLIRQLYSQTLDFLSGGSQSVGRPAREAAAKAALAEALPGWSPAAVEREWARHYPPYWVGFDTRTHAIFAELVRQLPDGEPAMAFELDFDRDATQACFAMSDHPGIFARLAGALALAGANVVDARTYTSTDGVATAAFWIQDREGNPYERARLTRLRNSVARTLKGEIVAREAFKDRDRLKKREKEFIVPTRISFDNVGSDIYTIIEVETRDRPGLLFDLTRTLTANNISISSAIITTYGEQAVDVFYVKDLFGLKLHTEAKRTQLSARLRAAIARAQEAQG